MKSKSDPKQYHDNIISAEGKPANANNHVSIENQGEVKCDTPEKNVDLLPKVKYIRKEKKNSMESSIDNSVVDTINSIISDISIKENTNYQSQQQQNSSYH